ncbi:unnamed protein product, partial [Medioppia subpectinata]
MLTKSMDHNVGHHEVCVEVHMLNFTLKGGPPWGFRIKQRRDRVIVSKINCGSRASKSGLRVHDEIIAEISESDQLTKLDFTYQLIKHTLNRQLHLSVRRHSDSELARHIYYHVEDEEDEGIDEENSDKDDDYDNECNDFVEINSDDETNDKSNDNSLNYNLCYDYVHEFMSDNVLPQLIGGLETIDEEDDEDLSSCSSSECYAIACDNSTALHQQHSEEEILSPSEDFDGNDILIPPPDIDFGEDAESPIAAFFEHIDQQSDKTSDILPLALSPDSDDSDMPATAGPTFKAKAPKNVWSPGSTTNSEHSSSTETIIPATALQFSTPDHDSYHHSKLSSSSVGGKYQSDSHLIGVPLSPTASEVTPNDHPIDNVTEIYDPNQTVTPTHKYWTLPRNIATATKAQYLIEDEKESQQHDTRQSSHIQLHHSHSHSHKPQTERHIHRQIITDLPPPSSAKYLYETENTKYFTLPTETTDTVTTTRKVIPAPPKSDGIGPVTESGIPIALKSGVKEEYASDWYKAWVRKMHKFDRTHPQEDEAFKIKVKPTKYKGRDYRLSPGLNEEESKRRHIYVPKNIAEYETGHSSISELEKQMEPMPLSIANIMPPMLSRGRTIQESRDDMDLHHRTGGSHPQPYHHPNCVFNTLTTGSGYESDSSYIIKKKDSQRSLSPTSRDVYLSVQRGDDIPLTGLRRPAPQPRAHKRKS